MNTNLKYWLVLWVSVVATSCNITKYVPENEQLLQNQKIVRGDSRGVSLSDELDNLKPKPNRRIFGIVPFHLMAHNYGEGGASWREKKSWHRRWGTAIGQAPVLIDSNTLNASKQRLSDYYFSKGFFNNSVSYSIQPAKRWGLLSDPKRARVVYNVDLNSIYRISQVEYFVPSFVMDELIENNEKDKILKQGHRMDFEKIESERNRLTALMRDSGFYYFNSSYIDFQIDTNNLSEEAKVVVNIRNKKNGEFHYQQTVHRIYVKVGKGSDTLLFDGLHVLEGEYFIKPLVLAKNIVFRPNELYNASKVQRTYSNLLSMGLFNFVTIRFAPTDGDSLQGLDAFIELQTAMRHDLTWEPQVITTEQSNGIQENTRPNYGIANNITLRNRNVFGGGESFNISAFTALETQFKQDGNEVFYNFRQSATAELSIPSLLYFERKSLIEDLTRKSTKFNASYLHDKNINYTRNVIPFNFTYAFTKGAFSYQITPFRLSINQAEVEPAFLASLDAESRFYTTQLLTNNFISGPKAFVLWTKKVNDKDYWVVRTNPVELSGNVFSLYQRLFTDIRGVNREVLGVKYSQYARADADVTFHKGFDNGKALVYRAYAGAGLPYGNTHFLPYERRFFVGGGSSLRAWRPRTIGPGSFSDSTSDISIEKTGEMMLQANVEYRFKVIDRYVNGAFFLDGGNMWNFREDDNFKNADFKLDRFYKEIALNTGLGLRFDFTYVIFRIDWGVAMHDPSYPTNERWVIKDFFNRGWVNENTAVNFAVNYPF